MQTIRMKAATRVVFILLANDPLVTYPQLTCVLSGSFREQLHANVQADAGEVLLHVLNELRDEATRDKV